MYNLLLYTHYNYHHTYIKKVTVILFISIIKVVLLYAYMYILTFKNTLIEQTYFPLQ